MLLLQRCSHSDVSQCPIPVQHASTVLSTVHKFNLKEDFTGSILVALTLNEVLITVRAHVTAAAESLKFQISNNTAVIVLLLSGIPRYRVYTVQYHQQLLQTERVVSLLTAVSDRTSTPGTLLCK
jgi:hypothetical protein